MPKTHYSRTGTSFYADSNYHYLGRETDSGNVFWVGSTLTAATTSGPGRTPDGAFSTLASALSSVTADNGDCILVAQNHTETITGAAGISLTSSYNGLRIIGLGVGRQRPTINFTTSTAASWDVTGSRIAIENLTFTNSIDNQTAMLNAQGADLTLRDVAFLHGDSSTQAATCVLGNASADRLIIDKCRFYGGTTAGTNSAISLVGGNDIEITRNMIFGSYHASNGVILSATTDPLRILIDSNWIANNTAGSTKIIVLTAGTTGFVTNNRWAILSGTAPITGAGIYVGGNTYVNAAGVTGASSV